jgi:hypothetical protein
MYLLEMVGHLVPRVALSVSRALRTVQFHRHNFFIRKVELMAERELGLRADLRVVVAAA